MAQIAPPYIAMENFNTIWLGLNETLNLNLYWKMMDDGIFNFLAPAGLPLVYLSCQLCSSAAAAQTSAR